jgi:hypothetical protein
MGRSRHERSEGQRQSIKKALMVRWARDRRDFRERFWEKVSIRGVDDCWPWTASRVKGKWDYGVIACRPEGKRLVASQVSWMLTNQQDIPRGFHVLHSCDVPSCCNPKHLSLGTLSENIRQCIDRGRWFKPRAPGRKDRAYCLHGHDLRREGAYYYSKTSRARSCAECCRLRAKMYQRKRRAALRRST